jgi:hypothetical protein
LRIFEIPRSGTSRNEAHVCAFFESMIHRVGTPARIVTVCGLYPSRSWIVLSVCDSPVIAISPWGTPAAAAELGPRPGSETPARRSAELAFRTAKPMTTTPAMRRRSGRQRAGTIAGSPAIPRRPGAVPIAKTPRRIAAVAADPVDSA